MSTSSAGDAFAKCSHCGNVHGPRCPEVKAIEYHPNGTIKRVEYLTPADLRLAPIYYPASPTEPWPASWPVIS